MTGQDVVPLPPGYHDRIAAAERDHWWHRGMRALVFDLLGARVGQRGALLDVGCGTGGLLLDAQARGFGPLAGVDPSPAAVAATRTAVPAADVRLAGAAALPFADATVAVVSCLDVLQHVERRELAQAVRELRRVLAPTGALVVRTNGGLRHREVRDDWRCFDARSLRLLLEEGGFRCERLTPVNALGSLVARARGDVPRAPTAASDGLPAPDAAGGRLRYRVLRAEAVLVAHTPVRLPYGHTLVALATPLR